MGLEKDGTCDFSCKYIYIYKHVFLWGGGLVSILNFWDISISQSSFSSFGRFGMKRSHTLSGLTCTNCWWKKSCTSQYPEDPSFHRVVYIPKWCRISSINSISHNMHIVFMLILQPCSASSTLFSASPAGNEWQCIAWSQLLKNPITILNPLVFVQGGPLLVISGVINPINGLINE